MDKIKIDGSIYNNLSEDPNYYYIDWFYLPDKYKQKFEEIGINEGYEIIVINERVLCESIEVDLVETYDISNIEFVQEVVQGYDLMIELNMLKELIKDTGNNIWFFDGAGYSCIKNCKIVGDKIIMGIGEIPEKI